MKPIKAADTASDGASPPPSLLDALNAIAGGSRASAVPGKR